MTVTFRGPWPARGDIGRLIDCSWCCAAGCLLAARPGGRQRRRAPLAARATRWWRWGLQSQRGLRELSCGPRPSPLPQREASLAPGACGRRGRAGASKVQVCTSPAAANTRRNSGEGGRGGRKGRREGSCRGTCRGAPGSAPWAGDFWSLEVPPLRGAEPGALGPKAVVSPQAEMDLEAARNGTARRLDGDFELGSISNQGKERKKGNW